MANGADIVMSDQSSRSPSQQHISHSYRFSPLAQAEDLDAYLMFILYRSRLSGPAHDAKSLKGGKVYVKPVPAYRDQTGPPWISGKSWFGEEEAGNLASLCDK